MGPHPHTFTISSRIFSSAAQVEFAFDRLTSTGTNDDYSSNVFSALLYAARLPFRPGVSKTLVLVTCDNSGKNDGSFYGEAMTLLVESGITLHHLTPTKMILGGKRSWFSKKLHKAASKISAGKRAVIGYDKKVVFTADGQIDELLRKQLLDPKNYLSTLAIESGPGTVFDLQKLEQGIRSSKKEVAVMISQQIVRTGGHPPECQVCDCLVNKDGRGSLQCSVCIMPELDIVLDNWEQYGKYLDL
jgi:hypothetical protein